MPHEINPADLSTLKIRPALVDGHLACQCGDYVVGEDAADGWIDENWPTEGDGKIRVTICPGCRRPWPTEGEQA